MFGSKVVPFLCLALLPAALVTGQECNGVTTLSKAANASTKACDCQPGWAGLSCDICLETQACSASNTKATCVTNTFAPSTLIHGLCEAPSQNISNLIHGKGWVSVNAAANGQFDFSFIKQNAEGKFVPLFKCTSAKTTITSDTTKGTVVYTAPDLACNLTCTVGAERTCTQILGNILKTVGSKGGAVVTCEPAKATCLISENTLDTFLGGVATSNCKLSECVAPVARMLRN